MLYDATSSDSNVNERHRYLFTKKGRAIEIITPTKDPLRQHIKRTMLKSRYTVTTPRLSNAQRSMVLFVLYVFLQNLLLILGQR